MDEPSDALVPWKDQTARRNLLAAIKHYRAAREKLLQLRGAMFPVGSGVFVRESGRYKGPGVVSFREDFGPDVLPVQISNGNTWCYDLENVEPSSGGDDNIE